MVNLVLHDENILSPDITELIIVKITLKLSLTSIQKWRHVDYCVVSLLKLEQIMYPACSVVFGLVKNCLNVLTIRKVQYEQLIWKKPLYQPAEVEVEPLWQLNLLSYRCVCFFLSLADSWRDGPGGGTVWYQSVCVAHLIAHCGSK